MTNLHCAFNTCTCYISILNAHQEGENVITTGCLDIALTDGDDDITLTDQFPISDADGMKLTPYTFTVTNNCNTSVDYQVALEAIAVADNEEIATSALKVSLNDEISLLSQKGEATTTVSGAYESRMLAQGTLAGKSDASTDNVVSYELRLWIDADASIDEMNKTFKGKITVSVGQGIFNPYKEGTLAYSILANNGGMASIKEYEDYKTTPADGEYGLYKAPDDLGTSYYFRGDATNNYVQFGSYAKGSTVNGITYDVETPLYWRIIRINGDGTIRLIYDGTVKAANGDSRTATIATTKFNNSSSEEKDIGYTYDVNGTQTDSSVKKVIDSWYNTHLKTNYASYIADGIFCNDREVFSVTYMDENANPIEKADDAAIINTVYAADARLSDLSETMEPSLKCTQKADRYTMSEEIGNGLLINPVGLITGDEVLMAGNNKISYLYSGESYWTSSPSMFGYNYVGVYIYAAVSEGFLSPDSSTSTYEKARPVINLKADVEFTGNGTIDSPYEIVME